MFGLQLVLIMLMLILITLFLLLKNQNYMFLMSLYRQEKIKNYQNVLVIDLKDKFIGMNIKQEVRIKIQHMSRDILSNLLKLIDYLFQLFQIKMILKELKLEHIIYQ